MSDEWRAYPMQGPVAGPVTALSVHARDSVTTRRVIRGGSFAGAAVNLRVRYRDSHPPAGAGEHVGFRCARGA